MIMGEYVQDALNGARPKVYALFVEDSETWKAHKKESGWRS